MKLHGRRLRRSAAAIGIPLLAAGAAAAAHLAPAQAATTSGDHQLEIQLPEAVGSIFIVGTSDGVTDLSNGYCAQGTQPAGLFWTPYMLEDGTSVTADFFDSQDCTGGLLQQYQGRVPDPDGNTYYVLDGTGVYGSETASPGR